MPRGSRAVNELAIFCADVGSVRAGRFGWAADVDGEQWHGTDISDFALRIAEVIATGQRVSLGFECPLFVPARDEPMRLTSARAGEGNHSWSAGAGTGALATGLVEVLWVMRQVASHLGLKPRAQTDWSTFLAEGGVFLWEAFVTAAAKGVSHHDDAAIAVAAFRRALPDPRQANAIDEAEVLSLLGACALRAGWSQDIGILSQSCLVIRG